MKRLLVKVCGMREGDNIRRIANCMPDYMGFIFVPESPRYAGAVLSRDALNALAPSIETVGVFRNATTRDVVDVVGEFSFSCAQLHGDEDLQYIKELRSKLPKVKIIKAISVHSAEAISSLKDSNGLIDLYIFDGKQPGSGEGFAWSWLLHYSSRTPFFVAGGVGLHNLSELKTFAATEKRLIGIDVNSKVEDAPGLKNEKKVLEIIEGIIV